MPRRKPQYPDFGSVSTGTMRTEDLLSAFGYECREWGGRQGKKLAREYDALPAWDDMTPDQQEMAQHILEEMFDCLNDVAPPYGYFGAHEGDGADYGWWLASDTIEDAGSMGILVVTDTGDIPKDYRGEVFHFSDHGNITLYVKSARKLTEIWSIV